MYRIQCLDTLSWKAWKQGYFISYSLCLNVFYLIAGVLGALFPTGLWWKAINSNTWVLSLIFCCSKVPNVVAQLEVWWHLLFVWLYCLSVDFYFQSVFYSCLSLCYFCGFVFFSCLFSLEFVCNCFLFFLTPGTDEETILKILTSRNNAQRQEIASAFKTLFGRVRKKKKEL